jgi:tetratricopeptide (TPR) repeat protein
MAAIMKDVEMPRGELRANPRRRIAAGGPASPVHDNPGCAMHPQNVLEESHMPRSVLFFLFALVFSHALLGCGGCANREKTAGKTPEIVWNLTPRAQLTYHYLALDLAMRGDDEAAVLNELHALAALPESDPRVFLEGSVWLLARKSPQALSVMEKSLTAHPGDLSLNLLWSEALLEHGRPEEALAHMRAYAAKHPEKAEANIELGILLVKLKRPEEAERVFSALPQKARNFIVEYYHARALLALARRDEALSRFEASVKFSPEFIEAWAELARLHEQDKNLPKARAAYEEMLRRSAGNPDVLLRLAAVSARMGDAKRALEYVRKGPDSPSFLLGAVSLFIENRQWDEAETLLNGLRASPDPPEELYFYLAGIAVEARNSPGEALRWIEEIRPGGAAYERAIPLKVQLLGNLGKNEEALAFLRRERERRADDPELLQLEIRMLASMREWDKALRLADEAARNLPDNRDMAFLHASLLDESGDKKAAFAAMEKIVQAEPDYYQALNYLGYTLADENRDLHRALEMLLRAVELAPGRAYIIDSLAWAQYRLGRFNAAWENIRKAVELGNSEDPTIWEHYGDIAAGLGNAPEARKGYGKALEFSPPNAESIRERLSKL